MDIAAAKKQVDFWLASGDGGAKMTPIAETNRAYQIAKDALEALEEAQHLLKNLPHAYKCSTYDDGGSCDCYLVAVNTFLGEDE